MFHHGIRQIAAAGVLSAIVLLAGPSLAASSREHGRQLARAPTRRAKVCSPSRRPHERYPVESLQEALGEGIVTGHPDMPEFRFDAREVGDFIAFLKTLE